MTANVMCAPPPYNIYRILVRSIAILASVFCLAHGSLPTPLCLWLHRTEYFI